MGWFSSSKKDKDKPKAAGGYPTASYPIQSTAQPQIQQPAPGAPPAYGAPQQPYPGQQQPYPGQQKPYPGQQAYPSQQPHYQQPNYPQNPNAFTAAPTPQNVTQNYNVTYQPAPVKQATFDSGARFDANAQARIPPPPPGVAMNSAQLQAAQGQSAQVGQNKAGFLSGGDGGGYSVMGGGLF